MSFDLHHDESLTAQSKAQSSAQVGKTSGQTARRQRRFSFDYGDDSGFGSLQSEMTANRSDRARALRRSHSAMDYVPTMTQSAPSDEAVACFPFHPRDNDLLASTLPTSTLSSLMPRSQRESSSSSAVTAEPQHLSNCTSKSDMHSPVLGAERDETASSVQSSDSRPISQASSINLATAAAITAVSLKARMEQR